MAQARRSGNSGTKAGNGGNKAGNGGSRTKAGSRPATRSKAAGTGSGPQAASGRDWHRIAEAAYLKAERRGFAPGRELEDWLEAERELGQG